MTDATLENKIGDIVVTTPKNMVEVVAEEVRQCIEAGGGFYFRTFMNKPKKLGVGSRIYYVEDNYVRGFGTVKKIVEGNMQCETTGKDWGKCYYAIFPAESWQWIRPTEMKGFQGWRYFKVDRKSIKIIGEWLDQKPEIKQYNGAIIMTEKKPHNLSDLVEEKKGEETRVTVGDVPFYLWKYDKNELSLRVTGEKTYGVLAISDKDVPKFIEVLEWYNANKKQISITTEERRLGKNA